MSTSVSDYIKQVLAHTTEAATIEFDIGVRVTKHDYRDVWYTNLDDDSSNRVRFTITRVRAKDKPLRKLAKGSKSNNKEDK